MRIHFINVGYGEAILLEDGKTRVLIDGGAAHPELEYADGAVRTAAYLQANSITHLDRVIMTHLHDDHISGLCEVLECCDVDEIWSNIVPQGDMDRMLVCMEHHRLDSLSTDLFYRAMTAYRELRAVAAARNIPLRQMPGDGTVHEVNGIQIRLFGMEKQKMEEVCADFEQMFAEPDEDALCARFAALDRDCNTTSLAMHVSDGSFSALLSGDKVPGWDALANQYDLRAPVLKITHHGQADGMPQAMLEGADPVWVVMCADRNRRFNSACAQIQERIAAYRGSRGQAPGICVTGQTDLPDGRPAAAVIFEEEASGKVRCRPAAL